MTVSFVNATHRWGGVKTWTLSVIRGLDARGHAVQVIGRPGDPFLDAAHRAGARIEAVSFGPDWNPWSVRRLRHLLAAAGSEVVVTNVSKDNRIAGPAARSLGLPVLQRVGGPGDINDRWRVRLEQRRYVTGIVVPARAVLESLDRFPWMRAAERVTVIHNGVDLDRFRPGSGAGLLRNRLTLDTGTPLLVATAQLSAIKGHAVLLDALASCRTPVPAHLALIGRGREKAALRDRARDLGLADRVHFLGFEEAIHDLLDDADIAVQPSLQEGFPNSVVEFMAKGKAIVASRLAGVTEALTDGVHGLLVPPGEAQPLAAALQSLLDDPDRRRRLGTAARARAEAEFALDRMIERVDALLRRLRPAAGTRR